MLDDNELLFDELYEKTKDCGRVQFINMLMEKERENQELKKQFETVRKKYEFEAKNRDRVYKMLRRKDGQQKEFIEWLEDMLVSELDIFSVVRVCDVLSKYKEIIGDKDE